MHHPSSTPPLAYLVSTYPAVSHTFILREIASLRQHGLTISTASINSPDRSPEVMDATERQEYERTYYVKSAGVLGAIQALLYWLLKAPWTLLATLWTGRRIGGPGHWHKGIAYAIEACMVARWMVRQNITHLHVHFGNAGASVGVLVKQLCQCHLSYTIHGPDEFDDVTGQQLRRKIAAADAIVCISQFVKSQLMRLSDPMHWPKMHLCRLGVNPQQFHFEPVESRPREDSEIAKVTRLLCVGRLTPAKCQVLLLQVCARLQNEGTPFQLTLIGDGPDRSRIERAIAELGLQRHVTLTGSLGQDAVKRYLKQSDIFVLPSLAEGIPVVLMEAMASGVPCISTSINGIPELIEHGHSGLLARPGDLDSLYDQLMRLIRDPRQRMAFSESGRSKVMADFQLSQNVRRLASVFSTFPASVG